MGVSKEISALYRALFPTGRAWRFAKETTEEPNGWVDGESTLFVDGQGTKFIDGQGEASSDSLGFTQAKLGAIDRAYQDIKLILTQKYPDNPNFTTDDLINWERVFGIVPSLGSTEEERKAVLLARYKYPNGIVERSTAWFLQDQLQKNGFDLYVHENRFNVATYLARCGVGRCGTMILGDYNQYDDVFNGIEPPPTPTEYCANFIDPADDADIYSLSGGESSNSRLGIGRCGIMRAYKPQEVNRQSQLRSMIFIGSEEFISPVDIPQSRQDELRILLLKLKPLHSVAVLYINWI